jgi:hypothetical protein
VCWIPIQLYIYLSGLVTAVAVFRNPNTIPFCLTTDLLLNILFSWLLVHLSPTQYNYMYTYSLPFCVLNPNTIIYLSLRSCDGCRRLPEPKHHSFLFNHWSASILFSWLFVHLPTTQYNYTRMYTYSLFTLRVESQVTRKQKTLLLHMKWWAGLH